jgi:hypothetical protein
MSLDLPGAMAEFRAIAEQEAERMLVTDAARILLKHIADLTAANATLRANNATLREALMNIRVKYCEWYDDEESEAIDVLGWVYDEARRVLALHVEKP